MTSLRRLFNTLTHRRAARGPLPEKKYYATLPRKISAGGVLLMKEGKMLVLQTTYQDTVTIPGGVVEKNESPRDAAVRECREEIGVDVAVARVLCVDYDHDDTFRGDGIRFIFAGDIGTQDIRPDGGEIKACVWMDPAAALKKMTPALARRVAAALTGLAENRVVYCEDGLEPPAFKPPPPGPRP